MTDRPYPYEINKGQTHYEGCWKDPGHHNCATDRVYALEAQNKALREALPASPRWAVTRRRGVVLLRYLGQERNEARALCQQAWELIRPRLTGQPASIPRIWLT